jgi:HAMP domain-containing protein
MKLGSQFMIAFVPLFLGLALFISAVMYITQLRECRWGLEEQASSLAMATARYLDGRFQPDAPAVETTLRRILEWESAQRLILVDADHAVIYDTHTGELPPRPPSWSAEDLTQGYLVTPAQRHGSNLLMRAYSPLQDAAGQRYTMLVEISATPLDDLHRRLLREIAIIMAAALCIGIGLARLLAGRLHHSMRELVEAARQVEAGHYHRAGATSHIREINDLGDTLNTMSSVLEEVIGPAAPSDHSA